MIRRPTDQGKDLRDSVFDVISAFNTLPKFEVKQITITAEASTTKTAELTALTMTKISGAVQIASTGTEQAYVNYKNTQSVYVSWDFGASTTGEQTVTFLLIGV